MNGDVTIMNLPPYPRRPRSRLYYYAGNFYHPPLVGDEIGRVKRAIRDFCKWHKEMISEDRAAPGYKNLLELFDEQFNQQAEEATAHD